jgi:UDP-glucose 4-epimerase
VCCRDPQKYLLFDFTSLEKILVTGAAGYIGSHTLVELCAAGFVPVAMDDLSNSQSAVFTRVEEITGQRIEFIRGDVRDRKLLRRVFAEHAFAAVVHFAGLKSVAESVASPALYYDVNVGGSVALLLEMAHANVKRLVFSSSATVYAEANDSPIAETASLAPTSPYGMTKRVVEDLLRAQHESASGWEICALRYFNPVGAHESGRIGEHPRGVPNNLLPYIAQVAVGKHPSLRVFGNDYPTIDGTGVRDYIHVADLARGHVAALTHPQPGFRCINLGSGVGTSVLQMLSAFQQASGRAIAHHVLPRRAGDIAQYFADASRAHRELNWRAERDIVAMCRDAWRWQSQNPNGYDV